jgi:hypothetical protein
VLARTPAGPLLLARTEGEFKRLLFGFHPLDADVEKRLAIPLLFANALRWMAPDLFLPMEIAAAAPGLVELDLPAGIRRDQISLRSSDVRSSGRAAPALDVPFTLNRNRIRFFVAQPEAVRLSTPDRVLVYRLTLPQVGDAAWNPPGTLRSLHATAARSVDLWLWLAIAGVLALLIEWVWYGRTPVAASAESPRGDAGGRKQPADAFNEAPL